MNMKKIVAAAVASVMAVSTMAIAASADVTAVTFKDETGKATLGDSSKGENTRIQWLASDLIPEGVSVDEVYGFAINVDVSACDPSAGFGGTVIFSVESKNWNTTGGDWNNETLKDGAIVRLETEPFFSAADLEGEWQNVVIDAYWGSGEVVVKSVDALDKHGNALTAGAETPADTTAADETPTDTTAPDNTPAPGANDGQGDGKEPANTGIEGVAVVAGLAVLATGAIVVAKKRK
ncbi:MAG: hypothetical protein K2K41_02565 [Ruminiclostridium sp.]|nr:hypothetical protein [Ruminiclostridium sp.]